MNFQWKERDSSLLLDVGDVSIPFAKRGKYPELQSNSIYVDNNAP
jgi:hypothetical protein